MNIIYASGIKGAGDTRYVMLMMFAFSLVGLAIPTYVTLVVLDMGIYAAWTVLTLYIIILSFAFLFRFIGGKWKSMSVIEIELVTIDDSATVRNGAISKA